MSIERRPPRRPRRLLRWPIYSMGQLYRPAYARLDAALTEAGLSPRMYQVLVSLDELGGLSQQQVSDLIRVDRSDMVRILDRLETAGYVVRERDPADRRRHVLVLTPAGRRAIVVGDQVVEQVTASVFAGVSEAERLTFHRIVLAALGEPTDVLDRPQGNQSNGNAETAGRA